MTLRALYDLPAPAKVNLFLHVVGRRDDGLHRIESVFQLVDWCDMLHVELRDDGLLQRHDIDTALPDDDLCLRAARLLQQRSGTPLGVDISIDKRVPWGAGLGGGSSDAATVLLALNRLWRLGWPRGRLLPLAASIGADVPFFVGGDNAFVAGIGDELRPVALQRQWLAVVKPPASIATADIFRDPRLRRDTPSAILSSSFAGEAGHGANDLQMVAEAHCPEVAQAARWLGARYGNSRMTGSGSAVFARAGTGDQPLATLPAAELPSGWAGRMCRSLERHPLVGWAAG